jgi:hypothetical protein
MSSASPFIILSEKERQLLISMLLHQTKTDATATLLRKIEGPEKRLLVEMPL